MGIVQFKILERIYPHELPSLVTNANPYLETAHSRDEREESHTINVEPTSGPSSRCKAKRISPIGGGNSLAVDPQATRSIENLGIGVNDARVIGNWRALRILPDSVAAAFSNWSDVAVISCDVPASSGSTRID